MNDDIKTGLDAELPPGRVPFSLDTDSAVRLGRRTRTRRRLVAGGGSVLSAVAIVALLVGVVTPGGFSDGQENAAAGDVLPDLDPDLDYEWMPGFGTGKTTAVTKAYSAAFWKHWNAEQPEAEPDHKQYDTGGQPTLSPTREPGLMLEQRELTAWKGDSETGKTVYEHPMLSLQAEYAEENATHTSLPAFQFGDGMPNFIDVEVIPDGQYRIGTEDVYDLSWCGGKTHGDNCEVTKTTGPDGERIENIVGEETGATDDVLSAVIHTSIVYRADGSAVIVSDTIRGEHGGHGPDEGEDLGDAKPALSFEELTAIALALPEKPLE